MELDKVMRAFWKCWHDKVLTEASSTAVFYDICDDYGAEAVTNWCINNEF